MVDDTKVCRVCGEEKPNRDYYKGHATCKKCYTAKVLAHRAENIERYRAYDRKRGNRQPPGYSKEYREKYPGKYKAINMVNNALRDGKMKRETECSKCSAGGKLHAHHDDYGYPLSVRWLCAACHSQWHRDNGEGANG